MEVIEEVSSFGSTSRSIYVVLIQQYEVHKHLEQPLLALLSHPNLNSLSFRLLTPPHHDEQGDPTTEEIRAAGNYNSRNKRRHRTQIYQTANIIRTVPWTRNTEGLKQYQARSTSTNPIR